MIDTQPNSSETTTSPAPEPERKPCAPPANLRKEIEKYEAQARLTTWDGPRYRMQIRELGQGPALILVPGVASTYRSYAFLLNKLAERFRTIQYVYPGDDPGDGARLGKIKHEHLVDDLFGLIDHLNLGRVFLFGLSFGSTVVLPALGREPRRFPKTVIQGGFAHRAFSGPERLALKVGRLFKGQVGGLPFHEKILHYNSYTHFPNIIADRWPIYLRENGATPIASLAHRLGMLSKLDLRPTLPQITNEILLIQGNEDRIVSRASFEELKTSLPNAQGVVVPVAGHQPHYTNTEVLAHLIDQFLLPCVPEGCANHHEGGSGNPGCQGSHAH